jgi:hypothetical protein
MAVAQATTDPWLIVIPLITPDLYHPPPPLNNTSSIAPLDRLFLVALVIENGSLPLPCQDLP